MRIFSQENELEQLSPGHRLESGEVVEFARRVSFFPVGADDFHLKWNQIWEIEFCTKKMILRDVCCIFGASLLLRVGNI